MSNAFFTGVESFLVETKENVLVLTQIMPQILGHSINSRGIYCELRSPPPPSYTPLRIIDYPSGNFLTGF